MTCTRPRAESQKSLDPWVPSTHDPYVWPAVRRKRFREVGERSCINVSGLCLERVALRAIIDNSARAISLADRPQLTV
jgi:hypothetical protein